MDVSLVIKALHRALGHRQVKPETLLIHTDHDSQYRATNHRNLLTKHGIACSIFAMGCCWDNAGVEIFFSTLKLELDFDDTEKGPISAQNLQRRLASWIEGDYNCKHRHSTIGSFSAIGDEQQFVA